MKYVMVESNTTGTGGLALDCLVDGGHDVVFLAKQASRYPFLLKHGSRIHVVDVDTNDFDSVSTELRRRLPIDALVTFSTFYVATVAQLAEQYGLPSLNSRTARICHDKPALRRLLRDSGLPSPSFWLVDSMEAVRRATEEVSYPCVVKPTADSGSNGVRLVCTEDELIGHCTQLMSAKTNERGQAQPGQALIEGLLEGKEFSVETMTLSRGDTHIVGVTAKHLSDPPHFVEVGHDFPATIPNDTKAAVENAAVTALDLVGYDFGPAHTEIRLTKDGPVIVEINPRLAGGMIPELVRLATGIDLLSVVLDAATGKPVALTPTCGNAASIRFIIARRTGVLRNLPSCSLSRRTALIRQVSFGKGVGTIVRPPECASDRLGFVIGSGPDAEAVRIHVEAALALIEHELEEAVASQQ